MFHSTDQPFLTSYPFPCCDTVSDEDFPLGAHLFSPFLQAKQQEQLGREMRGHNVRRRNCTAKCSLEVCYVQCRDWIKIKA